MQEFILPSFWCRWLNLFSLQKLQEKDKMKNKIMLKMEETMQETALFYL